MFIISMSRLQEMFGLIMLILIGIEILEAIKAYLVHQEIHVEVVLMVAVIAIAHKVIIIDFKGLPNYTLVGIGIIIVSLSISYYLIKKVRLEKKKAYQDITMGDN
ncbi:MAG: phosphate-starvation-inducible PsiE family protein [bacterium]|nr:phosphate-starvation-inducible PsiE family protein [bacterium]MDT8365995.1 phosphate-starvation-inducible PsiE family protein [bacterium]